MKTLLVLVTLLAPVVALSQEPQAEVEATGTAADCVVRATQELDVSDEEATLLCQGAKSAAPVDCWVKAEANTFLSDHQLLSLCSPVLTSPTVLPY